MCAGIGSVELSHDCQHRKTDRREVEFGPTGTGPGAGFGSGESLLLLFFVQLRALGLSLRVQRSNLGSVRIAPRGVWRDLCRQFFGLTDA